MSTAAPRSPNFASRLAQKLRVAQWSPWPLVAAGMLVIGLGLGLDLRRQFLEAEGHEMERLAAAADTAAHGVGQRLAAAALLLARLDAALQANPADASAIVHAVSGLESHLIAVLVIDAGGRVAASSRAELVGIDLSGDELVWSALGSADVESRLYLRAPAPALASSGHLAARARRAADGAFAGLAAVIVAPEYFESALRPTGTGAAVTEILDGTGAVVLRRPEGGAETSGDATAQLRAQAVVDSTLIAFDPPWSVQVARSEAAVFSAWSRQLRFGVLLWLLVAVVAIVAGVIGALRRNEIRRLRGLHRRLLQGVDEGLAGIDLEGHVRFANAAFARYLDSTPGELLGRDLRELLRWPDATADDLDPVSAVIGTQLPRFEGVCELGAQRLRATITPTREGGAVSGALLAFADPLALADNGTARSPADRLYRTLFDLSPDGVLIVDLDSERPLAFNPAAPRLLGYGSEEFGRLRVRDHEANAAPMDTVRHLARVLAEGRGEFETRYRTAQGEIRDVQVLAQTIEFAGSPALYWIVRDITERKRSAARLRESAQLAERANRARSEFLANMSHEIRTPMTAILGLTYLLQKTELSSAQRDHAQKIDSAARTLLAILDDLLDYSKLEAGRIAIERRPFVVRDMLGEIAVIFASAARDKALAFEVSTAANVPTALLGDAARLRQVLMNLVGNAIKFTEHGRVDVAVDAQPAEHGEVELLIAVRDTGIGIDETQRKRIFEPFYQAETSTTRRFGGTGLGLPITQWLINLMGGKLEIDSTPGQGSVFRVRLQLAAVVAGESLPPDRGTETGGPRLSGLSVLLVEDHPINRQVAREILVGEGARVDVAGDGHEAIARLEADPGRFDVVLMDIQMPRMDGFEATRVIRERLGLGKLPVIAMTANASAEDRAQSRAAGMDDHLAKPIDVHSLVSTVLRHARPGQPPLTAVPAALPTATAEDGEPPVLALEDALARLAGHRTLYAQMARLFAQEQGESVRLLREALAQGDRVEAARAAHTLKGVAATLGAEALSAVAARFERALKRHSEPDELEKLSDRLGASLADAIVALERAAESLAPAADETVPASEFDRAAFEDRLDALVLALVDSNMAALDHYAELRSLATASLLAPLRIVDDALGRLDFRSALDACRRVEAALDTLDEATTGEAQ